MLHHHELSRFFDYHDSGRPSSWIFTIESFNSCITLHRYVLHQRSNCGETDHTIAEVSPIFFAFLKWNVQIQSMLALSIAFVKVRRQRRHTFSGPFSGTTRVSRYQKVKPIWILLKQKTGSGSGINWAICKSAPRSRQIATPAPHRSVFLQRGGVLAWLSVWMEVQTKVRGNSKIFCSFV